ncbi:MAG: hypothetical protein M5R36_14150 [Deltaproteobacteria bacterium]|nr:hypothetical protein [Deltaproteobacteria bacterium]
MKTQRRSLFRSDLGVVDRLTAAGLFFLVHLTLLSPYLAKNIVRRPPVLAALVAALFLCFRLREKFLRAFRFIAVPYYALILATAWPVFVMVAATDLWIVAYVAVVGGTSGYLIARRRAVTALAIQCFVILGGFLFAYLKVPESRDAPWPGWSSSCPCSFGRTTGEHPSPRRRKYRWPFFRPFFSFF